MALKFNAFAPGILGPDHDFVEIGTGAAGGDGSDAASRPSHASRLGAASLLSADHVDAAPVARRHKADAASARHIPPAVLRMLETDDAQHAMYDALFIAMFARDMQEAELAGSSRESACTWKLRKSTKRKHEFKLYLNSAADAKSEHVFVFDPARRRWARRQREDELDVPKFEPALHALVLSELRTHGWRDDRQQSTLPFPEWSQLECVASARDPGDDACLLRLNAASHEAGEPALRACCTELPQLDCTDTAIDGRLQRPVVRSQCLDIGKGRATIPLVSLALSKPIGDSSVIWLTAIRSTRSGKPHFITSLSLQKLLEHLQRS